jgi:hypothetical protein
MHSLASCFAYAVCLRFSRLRLSSGSVPTLQTLCFDHPRHLGCTLLSARARAAMVPGSASHNVVAVAFLVVLALYLVLSHVMKACLLALMLPVGYF